MSRHLNTDRELLHMLDLHEGDGISMADIAKRMNRTKGSVIGAINRIRQHYDATECRCKKPANQDGGMQRRWWE